MRSSDPLLQFGAKILGLREKRRNLAHDLCGGVGVVSVRCPCTDVAKLPPYGPFRSQQAPLIAGACKFGEGHPCGVFRRRQNLLQIPPEHFMTELIGELEALDQPVAQLLVLRLGSVPRQPFAQSLHGIAERRNIERHRASLPQHPEKSRNSRLPLASHEKWRERRLINTAANKGNRKEQEAARWRPPQP